MPVALITGASRGLGLAIARDLAADGWALVIDARGTEGLNAAVAELSRVTNVAAFAGDVADDAHREKLIDAAAAVGGVDLLVNNASVLGPSPQPRLADYPLEVLAHVYDVNVIAPVALAQRALPQLRGRNGTIVNITSDAGVEPYDGSGGYGSSTA